jgi:cell division protein ZapA
MGSRVVHVDIHGQRYAFRSDLDPAYISELAAYLDEKIELASRETQSVDFLRVVIVAALNLTDELFRSRADGQGIQGRLLARAGDIERMVDQVLAEASAKAIAAGG